MEIRLHTLGTFGLEAAGAEPAAATAQPVRSGLLVLLALDREVTRETAMALLWPESDDAHARQALRQTLYLLRRDLGRDWLDAGHGTLRATSLLTSDAHDLARAAERDDHERVVALYGGSFVAGARLVESQPFQLWCDQWGSRLERYHRRARRSLMERCTESGDLEAGLRVAREWLDLDPLEDEAQHRVIEFLARLGRSDEALREFDRYVEVLAREELEPLDQTRTLVEQIRAGGAGIPELPVAASPGVGAESGGSPDADRSAATAAPAPGPRSHRYWAALLATAAAIAVGAGLFAARGGETPRPVPERVMVLPLVNETGDSAFDGVGLLAADWITHQVTRMAGLQAVPFLDVPRMLAAGLSPEEAAVARAAGTLVSGRYFRTGDSLELHVRINDLAKGELWDALEPVRTPAASPAQGLQELQERVGGSLGVRFTPESALPDPSALDPPAYGAFLALMEAAPRIARGDWAGAIPHLRRAAELDTTFYRARLTLVSAYRNTGQLARGDSLLRALEPERDRFSPYERVLFRGIRAQFDGDRAAMLAAAREGARIDPGGTTHYISAGVALAAGRPREAIDLYSTLDPHCPWAPEWTGPWADWTAAFHLLSQHDRELEEAHRALARHPGRLSVVFLELRALAALDRAEAVESRAARARRLAADGSWDFGVLLRRVAAELRVHGHPEAAERILREAIDWYRSPPTDERASPARRTQHLVALLMAEHLEEAERMLDSVQAARGDAGSTALRGVIAARLGDSRETARAVDRLEAARGPYQNGRVDYWKAVIAAWSGDSDRAITLLHRAFDQGRPRGITLHADPFLQPLWHQPAFLTAVADGR
ncbi:MAG: tetratricopeptide repeat protein [Candidatus Longimicrobiales bacterium M2_2A_002]